MSLFRELYPTCVTSFSDQYPAKLQPAEIDVPCGGWTAAWAST